MPEDDQPTTDYIIASVLIPLVTSIIHVEIPGSSVGHELDRRSLEVNLSKLRQLDPPTAHEIEIVDRVSRMLEYLLAYVDDQGQS